MTSGRRHLASVITWKPLAATAAATAGWLALTARPSPLLLSVSAAAMAAATPFVLDDSAAATLQSSPATLLRRRAARIVMTVPLLGVWWASTTTIVSRSSPHLPVLAHSLQLVTLVAMALAAASAISSAVNDNGRAGMFGALVVLICFGASFIPLRPLQLVPLDPSAHGAGRRLWVLLATAIAVQVGSSTDPARRLMPRRLHDIDR
jgi:hypothetical protein